MEEPIKAILHDIPSDAIEDLAYEDDCTPNDILAHLGKACDLTLSVLVDEDDFKANYWDAKFEDGLTLHGLSGANFKRRYIV